MLRNTWFIILVIGLLLIVCVYSFVKILDNDTNENKTELISDYFPIKNDVKYTYEGVGNEYASYTIQVDYTKDSMIQQRINNGGTESIKVIKIDAGKITTVFQKGEIYYRQSYLDESSNADDVLLMEPLEKGTTWNLPNSINTRTITNDSANITTPMGNYKAIEVTTKNGNDKDIDYFVKDIGLVKSVHHVDGDEITSSLSKIEENSSLIQSIDFYYPNFNDNKLYYKTKEVTFKTNDITGKILENAYKDVINNANPVLTANTKINKLYLGDDGIVYIDLSNDFIDEMNVGAQYENMILQCISNTFGKYYNATKVSITIDNNLYRSGHITMREGEYITVNYTNTVKTSD